MKKHSEGDDGPLEASPAGALAQGGFDEDLADDFPVHNRAVAHLSGVVMLSEQAWEPQTHACAHFPQSHPD